MDKEAADARALAEEIFQQIEVLMLQVFQLERRAADFVRTGEFARETGATLKRMQGQVNAQRAAANSVLEIFTPDDAARLRSS
jgi:hypothetical protein